MIRRISLVLSLVFCLFQEARTQNYSQGGVQLFVPTADFSLVTGPINMGVGFFGANRYFLNDNLSLKFEAGYTLLLYDGDIRNQMVDLLGGAEYCFRPEGYILRPYAGGTMGLVLMGGSAYFGLRPQAGLMVELGETVLLDLGIGHQFMFGRGTYHGFSPKLGIIMNLNSF
jgi:hypothetical protein